MAKAFQHKISKVWNFQKAFILKNNNENRKLFKALALICNCFIKKALLLQKLLQIYKASL